MLRVVSGCRSTRLETQIGNSYISSIIPFYIDLMRMEFQLGVRIGKDGERPE